MNHPRVDVTHPGFIETSAGRAMLAGYGARPAGPKPAVKRRPGQQARLTATRAALMACCVTAAAALAASLAVTLL